MDDRETMADHATMAVNYVLDLIKTDVDAKVWIESRVHLNRISPAVWGTADIIVYLPNTDALWVIDYKYGRVEVHAERNYQGMLYLLGAIETFIGKVPDTMMIGIIQPRITDPIKTWPVDRSYLIKEFIPDLKLALLAIDPKLLAEEARFGMKNKAACPEFVVSEETCTYCPSLHNCPAAKELAVKACNFDDLTTPPGYAETLDMVAVLKKWIIEQESAALAYLTFPGNTIDGWELGTSKTNRKWEDEPTTIKALQKSGLPVKDIAPRKLLGIPAITKIIKSSTKKIDPSMLDAYITRPAGKPRLQRKKP